MIRNAILPLLLAVPAMPQNLVVNDSAPGLFVESVGVSPLFPAGAGPINIWPQMFPLPPAPIPVAGAVTIDGTNGMTWYTDGFLIAAAPHVAYPAGAPAIPPFPAPFLGAGPISGMALDPVGGVLWLTDGVFVAGAVPIPGAPIIALPFVPGFGPLPPLTGLEWDPLTGSLWAVDVVGFAYNFLPGGAPLAGPIPPAIPLPGPATGIAIDKSGVPFGPGRSLYITGGGLIFDVMTGAVFPTGGSGLECGLSYHPAPSMMPPGPPAPCPSFAYGLTLRGPMTSGNPNFGVDLVGLPPRNIVIFAFDFAGFNPAFPLINGIGAPFGLNFGSAIGVAGFANAAGVASLPLSLAAIPPGVLFYMQYVTACPADPVLGVVVTPLYQVAVSAP